MSSPRPLREADRTERPGHPTAKAAALLLAVTVLIIVLAALSTF
jgi:hypothetical protein